MARGELDGAKELHEGKISSGTTRDDAMVVATDAVVIAFEYRLGSRTSSPVLSPPPPLNFTAVPMLETRANPDSESPP